VSIVKRDSGEALAALRARTGAGMMDARRRWRDGRPTWRRPSTCCAARARPRPISGPARGVRGSRRPLRAPRRQDRRAGGAQHANGFRGPHRRLQGPGARPRRAHSRRPSARGADRGRACGDRRAGAAGITSPGRRAEKAENIRAKIVDGMMKKFYEETSCWSRSS